MPSGQARKGAATAGTSSAGVWLVGLPPFLSKSCSRTAFALHRLVIQSVTHRTPSPPCLCLPRHSVPLSAFTRELLFRNRRAPLAALLFMGQFEAQRFVEVPGGFQSFEGMQLDCREVLPVTESDCFSE